MFSIPLSTPTRPDSPATSNSPGLSPGMESPKTNADSTGPGLPRRSSAASMAPRAGTPADAGAGENHVKAVGPMTSNLLLALTGGALIAEGRTHFVAQPNKSLARALIGKTQAGTGLLGTAHYANKLMKEPNVHNALGLLGSALFFGEGVFRMAEGEKLHLNRTSAFGFWAAAAKSANGGPLTTVPFALDAMCNGAEYAHGSPGRKGLMNVAHDLTHSWRTADLAAMQRMTGRVMVLIAAAKAVALEAATDPTPARQAAFARAVAHTYDKLGGDKLEQALTAAEKHSPEAVEEKLREFVAELSAEVPSLRQRLAEVLQSSPSDAAQLLKQHPEPARQAVQDLRSNDPQRYAMLRQRYDVEKAFG